MKYEYKSCPIPVKPLENRGYSDIPTHRDVAQWLNDEEAQGWEFVGQCRFTRNLLNGTDGQDYWIFRKECS